MELALSTLLGYLLGSLNPAALIAHLKHKNLRKVGTGNLGATNVLLTFGKKSAALVMLFDVLKAYIAVRIAKALFPAQVLAGFLAGCGAVVGHIFPFYMKFKGGKGLAAFGGFVLACDPMLFLFLLLTGTALMFAVNYSVVLPYYAGLAFPICMWLQTDTLSVFFICAATSALLLFKHAGNIKKALNGTDNKIREYAKKLFLK